MESFHIAKYRIDQKLQSEDDSSFVEVAPGAGENNLSLRRVITGLTKDVVYSFRVTSEKADGTPGSNPATLHYTAKFLPLAPSISTVGGNQLSTSYSLGWDAPSSDGR